MLDLAEESRRKGRPQIRWMDVIKRITGTFFRSHDRDQRHVKIGEHLFYPKSIAKRLPPRKITVQLPFERHSVDPKLHTASLFQLRDKFI